MKLILNKLLPPLLNNTPIEKLMFTAKPAFEETAVNFSHFIWRMPTLAREGSFQPKQHDIHSQQALNPPLKPYAVFPDQAPLLHASVELAKV